MPRAPSDVPTGAFERLGQRDHLGPRLGGGSAVAGDDADAAGAEQQLRRALDVALVGDGAMHRDSARVGLQLGAFAGLAELDHVALQAR